MRGMHPVLLAVAVCVALAVMGCPKSEVAQTGQPPMPAAAGKVGGGTPAPKSADREALFEAKCSKCHPTSRVTPHHESLEWWQATIQRMQAKKKGWISDDEAAQITGFLAAHQSKNNAGAQPSGKKPVGVRQPSTASPKGGGSPG